MAVALMRSGGFLLVTTTIGAIITPSPALALRGGVSLVCPATPGTAAPSRPPAPGWLNLRSRFRFIAYINGDELRLIISLILPVSFRCPTIR
jgi:hypothetical protein